MSLPKPYYQDEACTIYHGDCLEILPQLPESNAVITDPPYPREFEDVWRYLNLAKAPTLWTFLGHYQLPFVIDTLRESWEYFWAGIVRNNNCPIMHGFKVKVCWKPVLIFRRGKWVPTKIFRDDFLINAGPKWGVSKSAHVWGQSDVAMKAIILAATDDGDVVLDPFLGGGTTLRAAKDLGRKAIGIEIEERYCEIAARRLQQEVLAL